MLYIYTRILLVAIRIKSSWLSCRGVVLVIAPYCICLLLVMVTISFFEVTFAPAEQPPWLLAAVEQGIYSWTGATSTI